MHIQQVKALGNAASFKVQRFLRGLVGFLFLALVSSGLLASSFFRDFPKDPSVISPPDYLGHEIGKWHLLPHQIHGYFSRLNQTSKNLISHRIGESHQQQPLYLYVISDEANLKRPFENNKLRVWLGFSVHGNEPSGANSSILLAYYLLASKEPAIKKLLKETIIILEPVMNPDGLARHANWVNSFVNLHAQVDPADLEHKEAWPGGRSNHYWFDLNRDWILLEQPESKARLEWYHRWQPHVVGDFHEMGANNHAGSFATFFFQPGIPERANPLIPKENFRINALILESLAKRFDERGQLYFNEEVFDDFYVGKGSTYPDITGSIGILFEQASSQGRKLNSKAGPVSFREAIKNQYEAALHTILSSHKHRDKIFAYRKAFKENTAKQASRDTKNKAFIFGAKNDPALAYRFASLLKKHRIKVHHLAKAVEVEGFQYMTSSAFVVKVEQPKYLLIKSIFEENKQFNDTVFYDVSSWNLASAYGVSYTALPRGVFSSTLIGKEFHNSLKSQSFKESTVGYVIPWEHSESGKVLSKLLQNDLVVKVSMKPVSVNKNTRQLNPGALFVPTQSQSIEGQQLYQQLVTLTQDFSLPVYSLQSSFASGIDFGSPSLRPIKKSRIAMLVGDGISYLSAGEIWSLVDRKLEYPLTKLTAKALELVRLDDYTHLIIPSSRIEKVLNEVMQKSLIGWVERGGTLIVLEDAARWLAEQDNLHLELTALKTDSESEANKYPVFSEQRKYNAKKIIGGAIVSISIDNSHPLGYGYRHKMLHIMKRSEVIFETAETPFENVARYTEQPLISGYMSKPHISSLSGKTQFFHQRLKSGHVIALADSPNFRDYWHGANKLLINALFMTPLL